MISQHSNQFTFLILKCLYVCLQIYIKINKKGKKKQSETETIRRENELRENRKEKRTET